MRARRATAGLAAVLFLAASLAGGDPPPRPRLLLVIAVDQMRADYLDRFAPLFQGGLRALRERGAVFTNARYRHAPTETGPAHAVILSGRSGWRSGIVANQWYDPVLRRVVNVVDDPLHLAVGGQGRGASPANFIGFTLGDVLKRASPDSRVVGVSMKDRSAVLLAGRHGDAAYWYDDANGRFVTSTYYASAAPPWLEAWNARRPADRYAGTSWTRLLPDESVYRDHAGADAVEGEADSVNTTFPHGIAARPPAAAYYHDLRDTPFIDELTLEVALEAAAGHDLGQDDATDILALGFSATDGIGHSFGPDSQELLDQVLRLDRLTGRLLEEADRRAGPGRTLVVLTADHGVQPLVELALARGLPARRVQPRELRDAVETALRKRFPSASGLLAAYDTPHVYLDLEALWRQGLRRSEVEAVVKRALLDTGHVEAVYSHVDLLGDPPEGDERFALFRASFFAPRSPHLLVALEPYVYVDDYPGGTGHGTHHDYDRHVALAFLGPGIEKGRYSEACGPEDIAFTLAKLLGLDYPQQDARRALTEMMTPPLRPAAAAKP